ncbi:MAG: TIGR04086 family membrane protein [Lachnospiraceae bacterium]|nr:TIGR04086 family membrane protein [Lachnospiraceae bacterium]
MRQQLLDKESVNGKILVMLGLLVFAYVLTGALLLGLAFLLYKFRLDEKIVNIAVIVIYVLVTFLTGFLAGKKLKVRKFLWGFLLGAGYFVILAVVSMIAGQQETVVGSHLLTTFMLCAGGGMLGGMLS